MSDSLTNPNEAVNPLAAELAGAIHQIESLKAHAAQLGDELAEANQQLQALKTAKQQALAADAQVAEKMRHGLTRDQAINVIKRQLEFDRLYQPQSRNPVAS